MTPEIITDYHHARQNAAYYLAIEQPQDAATFTGLADAILQEMTEEEYQAILKRRNAPVPPVVAAPKPREESKLERRLDQQIFEAGLPEPKKNWFFLNDRNFELDRAYPAQKIAVEVQGMAHRIKGKFKADIEKRALAMLSGWRVLEVDGASIRDGRAIEWLKRLLA